MSPADGRRFGLTVGAAFLVLAALFYWRDHAVPLVLAAAAAVFFLAGGLLLPGRMSPVFRAWMRLGLAISRVTTPIFMGILFFLVIMPFGLVARAFGHRPLTARDSYGSFWRVRAEGERRSDLGRQF